MSSSLSLVLAVAAEQSAVWSWVHRLGGFGLVLLGVANSVIPLPGGIDAFTILLSAHKSSWWPYYGAMATVGAVIGGYITYRVARKGEKEMVEKKVGKKRAESVYKKFENHGFLWVFLSSILPPPFPMLPFMLAAGALQYPRRKFLTALSIGRGLRFFTVAYIGHVYGKAILSFLGQYYRPMLYVVIGLGVAAGIGALVYFKWYRPRKKKQEGQASTQKPEHKAA